MVYEKTVFQTDALKMESYALGRFCGIVQTDSENNNLNNCLDVK